MRLTRLLFSVLVGLWGQTLMADIDDERFLQEYLAQLSHPTPLSASVREQARKYEFVFIGGYLGDVALRRLGYFGEFQRQLMSQGVPRTQIHLLFPPSARSMLDNSRQFLPEQLRQIANRSGGRKLVVTAHSKAAGEMLAFALQDALFIEQNVHALILLSGAASGSQVADFLINGDYAEQVSRLPWAQRILLQRLARDVRILRRWIATEGLESLTTPQTERMWENLIAANPTAIETLSKRILYVQGSQSSSTTSAVLGATTAFLDAVGNGRSDGLVALDRQSRNGIPGPQVTLPDLNHFMACGRVLASSGLLNGTVHVPRAFIRALLVSL